jgi:U3 small nucleolar RNA-associated protein MPP10
MVAYYYQVSRGIEDIIKDRIKEEIWDDPIRKAALTPAKFKPKAAELSQEKSRVGLAEEYEKQYKEEARVS